MFYDNNYTDLGISPVHLALDRRLPLVLIINHPYAYATSLCERLYCGFWASHCAYANYAIAPLLKPYYPRSLGLGVGRLTTD